MKVRGIVEVIVILIIESYTQMGYLVYIASRSLRLSKIVGSPHLDCVLTMDRLTPKQISHMGWE